MTISAAHRLTGIGRARSQTLCAILAGDFGKAARKDAETYIRVEQARLLPGSHDLIRK